MLDPNEISFCGATLFLKLLKTQRKQLSSSSSFSNKRKKFSLPLRYATRNVKTKSTKCTFSWDPMKRNSIPTAVVAWPCSSSSPPCSWKVLLHAISIRLVGAASLPASTHHPTARNHSGSSITRVCQLSWAGGKVGTPQWGRCVGKKCCSLFREQLLQTTADEHRAFSIKVQREMQLHLGHSIPVPVQGGTALMQNKCKNSCSFQK